MLQVSGFRMKERGFTLIEVLLVVAILVVLAEISREFFFNAVKGIDVGLTAQTMRTDLRDARSRAMSGEDRRKWGIHFVNSADDYYELFSTPTDYNDAGKTVLTTAYLSGGTIFTDPAELSTKDILFDIVTGVTTASSVTVADRGTSAVVSVSAQGNID